MPEFLKFEGGRLVRTATQQGDTHLCGSHAKPGDGDDSVERYTLPREAFSSAHADYLEWKKKHPTKRFEGFDFSYCCYNKMAIRQSDFDLAAPYLRSFKFNKGRPTELALPSFEGCPMMEEFSLRTGEGDRESDCTLTNGFPLLPPSLKVLDVYALTESADHHFDLETAVTSIEALKELRMEKVIWSARPYTSGSVGFQSLTTLVVTDSEGFNPTPAFWASCKVLEQATLSGNPAKRKPGDTTPFLDVASPLPATLTSLSLRNLIVPALPPSLGECTALVELVVVGCGLTALPPTIGNLVRLETLLLGSNELDVDGIRPLAHCSYLTEKPPSGKGLHRAVDLGSNRLPDDCPTNCNVVYWVQTLPTPTHPPPPTEGKGAAAAGGDGGGGIAGLTSYPYADLEAATGGFAADRLISEEGAFGPVYRGVFGSSHVVAVKVMRDDTPLNADAFAREIATLQQCKHPNLLALLGCCTDGPKMCIVYEYKERGSLRSCLDDPAKAELLPWRRRLCLLLEISAAIEYLHQVLKPPIVHRDVKTANVLLSASIQASLGDFGLAKVCHDHRVASKGASTQIFGTPGYIDPEYAKSGKVTFGSDIYSFGIVVLELLTGRRAYDDDNDPASLIDAFEEAVEDGELDGLIPAALQWPPDARSALVALVEACTHSRSKRRPTASDVFQTLSTECQRWACAPHQLAGGGTALTECVICMDAPVTHALIPCGHLCLCGDDATRLGVGRGCPLCKTPIERSVRIYPS